MRNQNSTSPQKYKITRSITSIDLHSNQNKPNQYANRKSNTKNNTKLQRHTGCFVKETSRGLQNQIKIANSLIYNTIEEIHKKQCSEIQKLCLLQNQITRKNYFIQRQEHQIEHLKQHGYYLKSFQFQNSIVQNCSQLKSVLQDLRNAKKNEQKIKYAVLQKQSKYRQICLQKQLQAQNYNQFKLKYAKKLCTSQKTRKGQNLSRIQSCVSNKTKSKQTSTKSNIISKRQLKQKDVNVGLANRFAQNINYKQSNVKIKQLMNHRNVAEIALKAVHKKHQFQISQNKSKLEFLIQQNQLLQDKLKLIQKQLFEAQFRFKRQRSRTNSRQREFSFKQELVSK